MKFFAALSSIGLSLAGCLDHRPEPEHPQTQTAASLARKQAIRSLAIRIQYYHDDDSAAAAPDWQERLSSYQETEGGRVIRFTSRAAIRADLNRLLDSLRKTGPLEFGSREWDTYSDTIGSTKPHSTTHIISQNKTLP